MKLPSCLAGVISSTPLAGRSTRDAACEALDRMGEECPEALSTWTRELLVQAVRSLLNSGEHSRRIKDRQWARSASLSEGIREAVASGDISLLDRNYSVADGRRIALRDMDKKDLDYAALALRRDAETKLLEAAFLEALASKVRNRKVGDVLDEEKIAKLYSSIFHSN